MQLIWGRTAVEFKPPEILRGPAFTLINSSVDGLKMVFGAATPEMCQAADAAVRVVCSPFPATRGFMMLVALLMLLALWLMLTRTRIGLVIQSALTHPEMVEALGHNVPRVFMLVFGAGAALAGLAGVIGGSTFVTEPAMAATVGSVIFVVVVVGGMGSLAGAFLASILIGVIQTFAVALDYSLLHLVQGVGQFGLLFTGMKLGMPAGMASVVLQTQAFITMLLAAAFLQERPKPWQWLGLWFLFGLTSGRSLADCGRLGSIAAAAVIGHIGPRPGLSLAQMLYLAD